MNTKQMNRAFAALAFVVSFITYAMTVQPSVPFWDCGEFTAATIPQQVPHPPGAPLFLMVGKLFDLLLPFGEPAWRINMVSVVASALTVLLTYLITVMVINAFRKRRDFDSFGEAVAVFGSALVGSLALNFSDSFWFNGVESEVYASSIVFVALIMFLMMKWNEEADNPGHEKYILLIAYMIGLSTGVHLLSILAVFSIAMTIYFRKYDVTVKGFLVMGFVTCVVFFAIYPGMVKWFPALLGGDLPFKNEAREHLVQNSVAVQMLAYAFVIAVAYGLWYSVRKSKNELALACASVLLIILGYSTYTQVLVRANVNAPMNENNPNTIDKLVSYLGRDQYGDAPFWPRRYQTEDYFVREHKKYGEWTPPEYKRVERSDGNAISVPDFSKVKVNTLGELNYLWTYQMGHMYWRYFFWNFVGRASDNQDAPSAWFSNKSGEIFNYKSGYADRFPVRFFALPLIFGLIGMFYHFKKDPKMAFVFMAMFLVSGVLAAIQQNQQNPQPRERDYFYVGSFLIYCVWIGLGVYAIAENIRKGKFDSAPTWAVIFGSIVLVPLNMAKGGWSIHSRAGNYIPFDYAYNILQSVEKDAIVFTNGDNDTFPVWYLQDVAGVRRDVRIVNLSLGNTLWYIDQLKNQEPWGAKKIPLSFKDESLRVEDEYDQKALSYSFGEAQNISIPVAPEIIAKYTTDSTLIKNGKMQWTFVGQQNSKRDGKTIYVFRVQDQLVLDILRQTKFERPVYYSMSVGSDAFAGLENHFRMEGMAWRICPVPVSKSRGRGNFAVEQSIMDKCILNVIPGNDFFTEPHYGFKLRNLNNSGIFYDYVHTRLMSNYRSVYENYASAIETSNPKKVVAILDTLNAYISPVQFPMEYTEEYQIADLYKRAGGKKQSEEFAKMAIESCQKLIDNKELYDASPYTKYYSPYLVASDSYEILGDFDGAIRMLKSFPGADKNDPSLQARLDQLDLNKFEAKGDYKGALETAQRLYETYSTSPNPTMKSMAGGVMDKINEFRQKLGMAAMSKDSSAK